MSVAEKHKKCRQCGVLKEVSHFRPYTHSKKTKSQGRYRICRECEALNALHRRTIKRLDKDPQGTKNPALYAEDIATLAKIENMYKIFRVNELSTPALYDERDMPAEPRSIPKSLEDALRTVAIHHRPDPSMSTKTTQAKNKYSDIPVAPDEPNDDGEFVIPDLPPPVPAKPRPSAPAFQRTDKQLPPDLEEWLGADLEALEMDPSYLHETIYESLRELYMPRTGIDQQSGLPTYDTTYKPELNEILRKFDEYEESFMLKEEDIDYDTEAEE